MTVQEAYKSNPTLLGSPKMVSIYECLAQIPWDERIVDPKLPGMSFTSDGFAVAGNEFLGEASDIEKNLYGLFEQLEGDHAAAKALLANVTDWRG